MPTPFDDLLTWTGGHNSGGHQQQQQQAGLDNITVGHDSMEALVEAPTVGLAGDGTVVVSLSAGARASEAPKQTGTPALKVPQKTEMNTAPTTAAAAFSPMASTEKAVNRNQDKRTQSTPMPFEVQQLPPQPLPVVAQAMGVKMTEQARVHHPNDASLLPLMPIDFGDHNVPWDALGLVSMDAEPQQGPQQAAAGIPQWQDLYEQYWSQQQATQVLQAAQQLLVIFPQQPFLEALVQRLQEELMAWGDNVPMDLLY